MRYCRGLHLNSWSFLIGWVNKCHKWCHYQGTTISLYILSELSVHCRQLPSCWTILCWECLSVWGCFLKVNVLCVSFINWREIEGSWAMSPLFQHIPASTTWQTWWQLLAHLKSEKEDCFFVQGLRKLSGKGAQIVRRRNQTYPVQRSKCISLYPLQ